MSNTAPSVVTNTVTVTGGGDLISSNNFDDDRTPISVTADLSVTKSHTGAFRQGGTGLYTITVRNVGGVATSGLITVVDTLPTGLSATGFSGTASWSCSLGATPTCTRTNVVNANATSTLALTVSVASNAPAAVTNTVTISGGNELNTANNTATDLTPITQVADLTITKTHAGNFTAGGTGIYTITVSNAGAGPTVGTVTLTDTLPPSLTVAALSASNWNCAALVCTRGDPLNAGASYDPIVLMVTVAISAPTNLTNSATVSGGGELNLTNNTVNDATVIAGLLRQSYWAGLTPA